MFEPDTSTPPTLPHRPADGHKGTFGTVLIVGGCSGGQGDLRMAGAPALAARAAARAGTGLVRIAAPERVLDVSLAACPEATGIPIPEHDTGVIASEGARMLDEQLHSADAVVIGPGMGSGPGVEALTLRVLGQEDVPVVADADALNALSGVLDFPREMRAPCVLTPHPGEYRRLASELSIGHDPTDSAARPGAAAALAARLGCVVVLKGAGTVVSDGARAWVCDRGGPSLATGGTGDTLAGLLGGLIVAHAAKPHTPPSESRPLSLYDAARVAVDVHAASADAWSARESATGGLRAGELADLFPGELERRRG